MENNLENSLKATIFKYLVFWKLILFSIIISIFLGYIFLRYTPNTFKTTGKIEIIDDAMDSEMALPTAMTIFNRSTINLENEIQNIKSNRLIDSVVKETRYHTRIFNVGKIRNTETSEIDSFEGVPYELDVNFNIDTLNSTVKIYIEVDKNGFNFEIIKKNESTFHEINGYSTEYSDKELPINFSVEKTYIKELIDKKYLIIINPIYLTIEQLVADILVEPIGKNSDILMLTYISENIYNSEKIINTLIDLFDKDGIKDRQLVYSRTIDFVDSRFNLLSGELNTIENQKQLFKQQNNLSILETDTEISLNQKLSFENEVFLKETQLELTNLLINYLESNKDDLIPVNLGIEDSSLNSFIDSYNKLIIERDKFLFNSGSNNPNLITLNKQIISLSKNISKSLINHKDKLNLQLQGLYKKNDKFSQDFLDLPENEKLLRSIEREQSIKEALFLLLLQKREEAAINFAVTKPSLKIIDSAVTSTVPNYPNRMLIYFFSITIGALLPISILYIWFYLDDKIHTKDQLINTGYNIPVIGEIPYFDDLKDENSNNRSPIAESFRMLISNLNFVLDKKKIERRARIILVTSTIKGEGKTFISYNSAKTLASKFEKNNVLLIGADLRNPQIHKFIDFDKKTKGLSNFLSSDNKSVDEFIIKSTDGFSILLSGIIPPNPTQLLGSSKMNDLIKSLSEKYDYIVIDSAPCLLVSDTFEISAFADSTFYVCRAAHSNVKLLEFANECKQTKKLNNINFILNSVGNSGIYGYKYGYQYGYQYGYKYGYNYGYGYGYSEDK